MPWMQVGWQSFVVDKSSRETEAHDCPLRPLSAPRASLSATICPMTPIRQGGLSTEQGARGGATPKESASPQSTSYAARMSRQTFVSH